MNITYEQVLTAKKITEAGEYVISPVDSTQISVKHQSAIDHESESPGWKIHISIDDHNDNIKEAFNRLLPIMIKHNLGMAKFMKTSCLKDNEQGEYNWGRHITIYCSMQQFVGQDFTIDQWGDLLTEMTYALIDANIMPGRVNSVSHRISGSNYCSYRYDKYQGVYVSCREVHYNDIPIVSKYRLEEKVDLFEKLTLNIDNQPELVHPILDIEDTDNCCQCRIF